MAVGLTPTAPGVGRARAASDLREEEDLARRPAAFELPVRVARPVEGEGRPDPDLELPLLDPPEHVTRPTEQFVARQDVVVQARAREEERALDVQDLGVRRASRGRSQRATPVTSMTALTVRESFPRFYSLTPAPCALRSLLTWWLSSATRSPASQRASLTRPGVRPPAPEVGAVEYSPGRASGRGRPVPVSSPAGEAGAPGPTRPPVSAGGQFVDRRGPTGCRGGPAPPGPGFLGGAGPGGAEGDSRKGALEGLHLRLGIPRRERVRRDGDVGPREPRMER
jgi:hypothetical protein